MRPRQISSPLVKLPTRSSLCEKSKTGRVERTVPLNLEAHATGGEAVLVGSRRPGGRAAKQAGVPEARVTEKPEQTAGQPERSTSAWVDS